MRRAIGRWTVGLAGAWVAWVGASALRADDTWLQPEQFAVTPGVVVRLDLTSAAGFGRFQTPAASTDVVRTWGRLGGAALASAAMEATEQTLRFPLTVGRTGFAVFGVEMKARERVVAPEEIERYLEKIHAGDDVREAWAAVPEPRRWRERTVRFVKTVVRVGEPIADDRSWAEPLGLGLEIVPERDPTKLREGEALPMRVWRGGRPVVGFVVGFISAGETREHVAVTDAEGRASAVLDLRGNWLVQGTDLRRAMEADREWDSEVTTLVVRVQ